MRIAIRLFENRDDRRETPLETKLWKTIENCLILTATLVHRDSLYVIQVFANWCPVG